MHKLLNYFTSQNLFSVFTEYYVCIMRKILQMVLMNIVLFFVLVFWKEQTFLYTKASREERLKGKENTIP